jgi:hypothetical protein
VTGHQWLDVLIGIAVVLLLICLLLIAALDIRRPKGKTLQLAAAYRRFSSDGALPRPKRSLQQKVLVLLGYCCLVLAILNVVWFGLLLSRDPGERVAAESTSTRSATAGGLSSSAGPPPASAPRDGSAEKEAIQLWDLADSARPFQRVRIQGTYRGGADTLLRVQRREGGKWLAFPLPTKTNHLGQFTTYVEFGKPGRYQLRVLDPDTGVTSKPFLLVIKG